MRRPLSFLIAGFLALATVAPAQAHDAIAPRAIVDGRVVTQYEVEQRVLFLQQLRATGDLEKLALNGLIDDRLRVIAAERAGLKADSEKIKEGMAEFAGRAQLTTEQFLTEIGKEGVAPETFRDFVAAGQIWRELVQERFAQRTSVTDHDIDRALATYSQPGGGRVLLAEIALPRQPDTEEQALALVDEIHEKVHSYAEFEDAARQVSAAPSREAGGQLPWLDLAQLPPVLVQTLLTAKPGEIIGPILTPQAILVFQMRGLSDSGRPSLPQVSVQYARYLIPGGHGAEALAAAADVRARADGCNDLYGLAKGQPEERLQVLTQSPGEIPADIAYELAKLDEGEISTTLESGGNLLMLMLCKRELGEAAAPDRAAVRNQLVNQRIGALAEAWLAELRAQADIRYP